MSVDMAEGQAEPREELEPITDIVPGEIVTCLICMCRVAVTKVEGGLVRHFDPGSGGEYGCGVHRDDIVKDGDLDERVKKILNRMWIRSQNLESRLSSLEAADLKFEHTSRITEGSSWNLL